ncbi:hypothetical protein DPMN_090005 [Dreissena polymorpha]|uniref:Uncharacterized protein n=1 Tax=Dreissena polymorpha TaxID=45954 RepID=A0A9D4KXU4_DREPO|nr:hypothetical protein DPMN_090005 [Dreissena polymorpha]
MVQKELDSDIETVVEEQCNKPMAMLNLCTLVSLIKSKCTEMLDIIKNKIKTKGRTVPVPSTREQPASCVAIHSTNNQTLNVGFTSIKINKHAVPTMGSFFLILVLASHFATVDAISVNNYPKPIYKQGQNVEIPLSLSINKDYTISDGEAEFGACNTNIIATCYLLESKFNVKYDFTGEGISWKLVIYDVSCNDTNITMAETGHHNNTVLFSTHGMQGCSGNNEPNENHQPMAAGFIAPIAVFIVIVVIIFFICPNAIFLYFKNKITNHYSPVNNLKMVL